MCREWLGCCRVGDESDQIFLALFSPFLHSSSLLQEPSTNINCATRCYNSPHRISNSQSGAKDSHIEYQIPNQELQTPSRNIKFPTRNCSCLQRISTAPACATEPRITYPNRNYGFPQTISWTPPCTAIPLTPYEIPHQELQLPSRNIKCPTK